MGTAFPVRESYGSNVVTVDDVESLFLPFDTISLPYELLEQPPIFTAAGLTTGDEEKPPIKALEVREDYPSPVLSLPLWEGSSDFLNKFVRATHADLIREHAKLVFQKTEIEKSAQKLNQARREAWKRAFDRYQESMERFREAKTAFERARDTDLELLRRAKTLIASNDPEGVVQHFDLILRRLRMPSFIPRQWTIHFEPETKTLLLEHRFPEIARLNVMKNLQQTRGTMQKPVAGKVRKSLISKIQPALCLQLAVTMAKSDLFGVVQAIVVNGWVDFFDRATGQPRRSYCASLIAKKDILLALNLKRADPIAAFNSLHGANVGEAYETVPIMPSLRLQTDDPRFIESRETIEKMIKGENLAAMDWEDFEHLVRELFEREFCSSGAQVKVTRASRDQGVDAVIFDPDPIKGGKIVIQAKRYTLPVEVAAVRDLYGTVINEGANTGILVTTSHYGAEAYEFAQNKNLKLINGAQLLGLLEKAGYHFRIDVAEARALAINNNHRGKTKSISDY